MIAPGAVLGKELRALAPMTASGLAGIAAASWLHDSGFPRFVLFAYVFGALAAGAQSIGHEFTDRTLSMLLSQPAPRRRVLGLKLSALGAALVLLAGAALVAGLSAVAPIFVVLPVTAAFFGAPWLTMVCRSALAGGVFTFAIPATLYLATHYTATLAYGALTEDAERLARLAWYGLFAVALIFAGVDTWRRFTALEASDGASEAPFQFPAWRWRSRGPSHPLAMLVRKELHLHHISVLAAGAYVAIWLSLVLGILPSVPDTDDAVIPLTMIFVIVLPLLIGATTSAEERMFGTREWHLVLPFAAWLQWVVKTGVSLVLAVGLGIGVPLLLSALVLDAEPGQMRRIWRVGALTIVPLTAVGIYVSSVSTSGVRAIAVAYPSALLIALLASWADAAFTRIVPPPVQAGLITPTAAIALLAYGLALLGLRFAYVNHAADRPKTSRVLLQIAIIVSAAVTGLVAVARAF